MRQKQVGLNFVRNYLDENGDTFRSKWKNNYEQFREDFAWEEEHYQEIFSRLKEQNLVVSDTVSESSFKSDTLHVPEGNFEQGKWMIGGILKAELASQVWGMKRYYPVINDVFDNYIEKSMNLWDQARAYSANNVPIKSQKSSNDLQ